MALRQDVEKLDVITSHNEAKPSFEVDASVGEDVADPILEQFSEADVRRVVRKIDWKLIPICGLMYCVSLLDRTNLSNAAIAGMTKELELETKNPDRYSIVTLVFFITYVLGQPPTTIMTRFFGPRLWLGTITLCWGATMIGFGFVKDWKTLVGLRLILGILESGFFPGVVYLLSTWYRRYEMGKRYSIFYLIGSVRFLTPDERRLVIARVNEDRGDADVKPFSFKKWAGAGADWRIWGYGICFGCTTTVTYALAYFLPIILNKGLGFDTGTSQCLIAPPYVLAGILMYGMGWDYADTRARYFGVFFATAGSNANIPCVLTYQANNIRGQWKRAFCSATLVGMGAVGGIVGSTVFRSEDTPKYIPGLSVALGSQVVILVTVAALTINFRVANAQADRGERVLEDSDKFRYTF